MRPSRPAKSPLLLLLILLLSCGLLPKGGGDRTTVSVTPAGDEKPHLISVAVAVAPVETFREGIARAGAGLRTGGERKGIRVQYCILHSAAEEFLLETLQVGEGAFSPPVGVAAGDEVEITGQSRSATRGGCSAHVLTRGADDRIESLELGIVARPADGSLLPVLRARIPLAGSGTYLLSFESASGEAFGLFLRLGLAGGERAAGTETYHRHRLSVLSWSINTVDLSRILRLEGIEERGGLGGIVLETLRRDEIANLERALDEDGKAEPETSRILAGTANTTLQAAGLNLLVRSSFAPVTATYVTEISVRNRGTLPPLGSTTGAQEVLLLLGWDAERPGRSTVALLSLSPVE